MAKREALEGALQTKIDNLLYNLGVAKLKEEELKRETIAVGKQFSEEDEIITQLESKLKTLEEVLLKMENDKDEMKSRLLDAVGYFDIEREFYHVEKTHGSQEDQIRKSKELKGIEAESNTFYKRANSSILDILEMTEKAQMEEERCEREEERVLSLEKELREIDEKLATAKARQASVTHIRNIMAQEIADVERKRVESETKADELEIEAQWLEKLLDDLGKKFEIMKSQ